MATGVADHIRSLREITGFLDVTPTHDPHQVKTLHG